MNVAVTDLACVMLTTQLPVPEHAPLHPLNTLLADGVAVSVTEVPEVYVPAHVPLGVPAVIAQLIEPGDDVTVPFPVPAPSTVRS